MSHHYRCPSCSLLLQSIQELSGRKVLCKGCNTVFTAGRFQASVPIAPLLPHRALPTVSPPAARQSRVARRKKLLVPLVAVVAIVGIAGGVIGLIVSLRESSLSPESPLVAQASPNNPNDGVVPGVAEDGSLPIESEAAIFIQPELGQEPVEDVQPTKAPERNTSVPSVNLPPVVQGPIPRQPELAPEPKPRPTKPTQVVPPAVAPPPPSKAAPPEPGARPEPPATMAPSVLPVEPTPSPPTTVTTRGSYAAVDAYALQAPTEAEASIVSLAKYLHGAGKSERERARAIYRWITDRIAYDTESFFSGQRQDQSPGSTLQRRKAVCEGYSQLFLDLCNRGAIKAAKVRGYSKGFGYSPAVPITKVTHAWNAVRVEGQWCLLDSTWGAGSVADRQFQKTFKEFYFLTPPDQMIFTHLPEDPQWQLRRQTLSLAEFNSRPRIGTDLFGMGVTVEAIEWSISEPSFREPVKSFKGSAERARVISIPLTKHLRVGQEYRFEIRAEQAEGFVFVQGNQFIPLKLKDGVFNGTIRPAPGPLHLGAKLKVNDKGYSVILEYAVE